MVGIWIHISLSLTSEIGQNYLFTLISMSNNHLLLGQYLRPSLKGSWHQPTNTTPMSPGAQNACRDGDQVERTNKDVSRCENNKNYVVKHFLTYLTRWDILRYSFQYSDVVTFDIQNTKYWTAFTDQCFSPILMVDKLLPLQVNKENISRLNRNLKKHR